jgi:glycosidase
MTTRFNQTPSWVKDAVFYQIFPDRFARSDRVFKPANLQEWDSPPTRYGFKGGDLLGIVERLDYLVELGITALYLNPIFVSGANHRYHTDDYYQVDPLLGGNEALDELIAACHDRGIRVVLDGVFNHVGRGFHQFHSIVETGADSPYVDWFTIDGFPLNPYGKGPANYLGWYNLKPLPRLNTDNPVVREYIMQVAEHWLRRGIDGWRLDVPNEITADGFWEEFRQRVRAINPEAYIVGEIWEDSSEYIVGGTRFDATMNYLLTVEIISFVIGEHIDPDEVVPNPAYFGVAPINAAEYAERIDKLFARYPMESHLANLNLLESHDTARLLATASDPEHVADNDLPRRTVCLLRHRGRSYRVARPGLPTCVSLGRKQVGQRIVGGASRIDRPPACPPGAAGSRLQDAACGGDALCVRAL